MGIAFKGITVYIKYIPIENIVDGGFMTVKGSPRIREKVDLLQNKQQDNLEKLRLQAIAKGAPVYADRETKPKKEWTEFCLRIRTSTLEDIAKIIEERAGISKTGWILETIQERIKKIKNQ